MACFRQLLIIPLPRVSNHADISALNQEFYLWPLVTEAAQKAIKTRMQLIDYFYTQLHYQTLDGIPRTILPLMYVYPNDTSTLVSKSCQCSSV